MAIGLLLCALLVASDNVAPPTPTIWGDHAVKIEWAATTGAQGYCIERSDRHDGPFRSVACIPALWTRAMIDAGVHEGRWYFYRVRAKRHGRPSERSVAVGILVPVWGDITWLWEGPR